MHGRLADSLAHKRVAAERSSRFSGWPWNWPIWRWGMRRGRRRLRPLPHLRGSNSSKRTQSPASWSWNWSLLGRTPNNKQPFAKYDGSTWTYQRLASSRVPKIVQHYGVGNPPVATWADQGFRKPGRRRFAFSHTEPKVLCLHVPQFIPHTTEVLFEGVVRRQVCETVLGEQSVLE